MTDKLIVFDPGGMSLLEQVAYLHKLASSLNSALELMQNERNELQRVLGVLSTDHENLEKAYTIQKNLNTQIITDFNEEKQQMLRNIQRLEAA